MRKIDSIIEDIKNVNRMKNHAWIYDDNGNIKDDVICGNVIDLLEELKPYEVETFDTDKSIDFVVEHADDRWNTYNWNANIDHDIDVAQLTICECTYMAIMVHRYGDVRGNYTDRFLVKFDNEDEIFYLESRMQYKTFRYDESISENRYCADIDIFSETYNVWDWRNCCNVGEFYEIEVEDLLKELEV